MEQSTFVPILPIRRILFRENIAQKWRVYSISILGRRSYASVSRAAKPLRLIVQTDIEGFERVEIVDENLFSALAQALISVESLLVLLDSQGEVRTNRDIPFDKKSDTILFGDRIQNLRQSLG